jgi:translation elongation factor EF-1beta
MKRFFFGTLFIIVAVGVGWRYAPSDTRERLLGFVGMANSVDPARVARDIKEKIMPEDPAVRRAALTTALRQKIMEIQESAGVEESADSGGVLVGVRTLNTSAIDIVKAADDAAQLVNQLEQSGGSGSVAGQAIQRVIDKILPAPQCKE